MSHRSILEPGLVIAANHEPLSHQRRAGHASVDQERRYLDDHREENIRKLAESGCDMVRVHFYKGFGLEAEKEEMALSRQLVRDCHAHGLKVQLYVQFGTLQSETLLAERPEMMDWVQVDELGRPITLVYGHQTYRHYPCLNRGMDGGAPGYWDYLEQVIRIAIEDLRADAIGLDNISTAEEPVTCRCQRCRDGFVESLKRKYRPDTAEGCKLTRERFGHSILDHIQPPTWNYFCHPLNLDEIRDPVFQEWILFRCESLRRVLERLYRFAKRLDPDVLLELNAYKQTGSNTAFLHGIYVPDLSGCIDAFWNECDPFPICTEDGRLLGKVRGYKMAAALGKAVFANHPSEVPEEQKLLAYAESMAFNRGIVGGLEGAAPLYLGKETAFRRYRDFARKHAGIYQATSLANVAMLESRASLAFSNYTSHLANLTMHQGLLRSHVPYDLVFDLASLERYRVLVLADAACLADEEIEGIVAFVRQGGGLLMTGDSGEHDTWRRHRGQSSLRKRLGLPDSAGGAGCRLAFGDGRVAWVEKLESLAPFEPPALSFKPFRVNQPLIGLEHWKGPSDLASLADDLDWVAAGSLPVSVLAPEHVVVDLQRSTRGPSVYLHLVNYRVGGEEKEVSIRFAGGIAGDRITCISPHSENEVEVRADDQRWLRLPKFHRYQIVCASADA